MATRPFHSRGFTLLELILVMLILTLVVAAVAPSLRGFAIGRRNSDMASLIVGLAHYARAQAVSESRVYRLCFDSNGGAVWLLVQDMGVFDAPPNDWGRRFDLAEGVQMRTDLPQQPEGQYVEFQPTGRTDMAHIWLTDPTGDTIEIACTSATELFRILPNEEMTP